MTYNIQPTYHNKNKNKNKNGPYQGYQTRDVGPQLHILQLNIEGISRNKAEYLSRLLLDNKIKVLLLQETHAEKEEDLLNRGSIAGFRLAHATYHNKYGTAIYIRNDTSDWEHICTTITNNISLTHIRIGEINIINVYKPPGEKWTATILPQVQHPTLIIGDFNSHHSAWGYDTNDENGNTLYDWVEQKDLALMIDLKDVGTFRSARWQKDYNPDLCFVTKNNHGLPVRTSRQVLSDFPRSQHRPIFIKVGIQIPITNSILKPRWNFLKADWNDYRKRLDDNIRWIKPEANNYDRFVKMVIQTAKKCIPRGYRKEYIPGWSKESDDLYNEYHINNNPETADALLNSLSISRKTRWMNTIEEMDFKHSSRKAWNLLRKIDPNNKRKKHNTEIKPNAFANRIIELSRAKIDNKYRTKVKTELRESKRNAEPKSTFARDFTDTEITTAIKCMKSGKAAGFDDMYPEFLKHSGPKVRIWLSKFYSDIIGSNKLPRYFKKTKILAILKPGKPSNEVQSYRPIALLSVSYKLLERLVFNRISDTINQVIPIEQAGFRSGRNCCDQVLALTTRIENGFEKQLKTATAFIDLTAAYDTVWREGLITKFLRIIPCQTLGKLLNNMLSNRLFKVIIDDAESKQKTLNNGLPQGSVLAPLLFNLYTYDIPPTDSGKYIYADDIALVAQAKTFDLCETTLNKDLESLNHYFKRWRLKPNPMKTEVTLFHLCNKMANHQIDVIFDGQVIKNSRFPKYLGVTLDRTLTYKEHLTKTAAKLKTRNNIIQKLANSEWGADSNTLRISTVALTRSVADYCSPVWLQSAHTNKVDTQLNSAMRIITGAVKSTPIDWLPVLSNLCPPHLHRYNSLIREWNKCFSNTMLPIQNDINTGPNIRLKSRKPTWRLAQKLISGNFNINTEWNNEWKSNNPDKLNLINNPTEGVPGSDLPRRDWVALNRLRTGHGRTGHMLHKWGLRDSPGCNCGHRKQTATHITDECTIRRFQGGMKELHKATTDAVQWLNSLDIKI